MDALVVALLSANLLATCALLLLDKRRDLVTEILRKVKLEDEGVVIAVLTRDDKELGVSMSEGAAYAYPRRVCDELVHRGWAKRVA